MSKKDSSTNPEMEMTDEHPEVEAAAIGETGAGSDENRESPNHEELTLLLEDARSKADEHWNQLLRANAELENTRRRARQDIENAHKFALEKFALELLPVRDSLEMGLAAAANGNPDDIGETVAHLKEGTELTLKMLTTAMQKFGIESMDPVGEPFNPEIHQAMSMQESADHAPNTVMLVMQKGYTLNDRLIRPAMVVVSKAVATQGGENPESASHVDEKA